MIIETDQVGGTKIATVISDSICFATTGDAVNLMADCYFNGTSGIIIHEMQLMPDFFDLKTGVAGEILQKFSTYGVRLAIVGDFSKFQRKSLLDFITESNKFGHINFVSSVGEAKEKLVKITR